MTVAGTTLDLHTWTYDQYLRNTVLLVDLVKLFVADTKKDAMAAFLRMDSQALLSKYGGQIKDVLVDSVLEGNFQSKKDAQTWVEALRMEHIMDLFVEVWKDNMLPFAKRLGVTLPPGLISLGSLTGQSQST